MDTFICQRMNVLPFTSFSLLVGNSENDSMFFLLFTFFLFSFFVPFSQFSSKSGFSDPREIHTTNSDIEEDTKNKEA